MAETRRSWSDGAARTAAAEREPGTMTHVLVTDVLDERVLHFLALDLGQPAADRLAEQYRDGLKERLELLAVATFDCSVRAVYDTAMDLAVSGATVGAVGMARAAWAVARDVVRHRTLPRVETLERLMRLAHDTEAALVRHLRTDNPAPGPYG